jgi:hypothetical protein
MKRDGMLVSDNVRIGWRRLLDVAAARQVDCDAGEAAQILGICKCVPWPLGLTALLQAASLERLQPR